MAVFLINICKFGGCGITFPTLGDLIQHIEDTHLDYDPRQQEKQELQQPACLPLSYILRFYTDAARKEYSDTLKRKQRAQSPAVSIRSTTPTGSEFDDDELKSESDDSNDSWTTQEEFSSEFILRYGSRMVVPSNPNEEKPFACPVPGCKKRYKNVNGIKYHAKNGHRKDARVKKAFKCQCGKSYKTSKGLRSHAISHHNQGELLHVSSLQQTQIPAMNAILPATTTLHVSLPTNVCNNALPATNNSPRCSGLVLNSGVVTSNNSSPLTASAGLPSSTTTPPCCIPNALVTPPSSASPQPGRTNNHPLQVPSTASAILANYCPLTPTSPNTPHIPTTPIVATAVSTSQDVITT